MRVALAAGRDMGDNRAMTVVILGLLGCLLLSVIVMGIVAIPARREGRGVLTERGERVVVKVRERADSAASRTSSAVTSRTQGRRSTS